MKQKLSLSYLKTLSKITKNINNENGDGVR